MRSKRGRRRKARHGTRYCLFCDGPDMPGPGGELVIVITEAHVANDRPYQGTQNNKSDVTILARVFLGLLPGLMINQTLHCTTLWVSGLRSPRRLPCSRPTPEPDIESSSDVAVSCSFFFLSYPGTPCLDNTILDSNFDSHGQSAVSKNFIVHTTTSHPVHIRECGEAERS